MLTYDDIPDHTDGKDYPQIVKIIVNTEQAKQELIKASEYIHYLNIDTNFVLVNDIAHLYRNPDLIVVQ